ncbi:alpha/beta fold hydrolase [Streptomyces roseicoloratus]|uniref:alpha/beta fold hydrolase n=1 Tax=Streptomyces roseicoloratus TaxID=2508722 RepID=UPI0035A65726
MGSVAHHVVVDGTGPVCVLAAGLGMSWFDWDPVVPLLTPHRTVVRFDRPGHGLSQPSAVPSTAAGEADRIAAVLDAVVEAGLVTDRAAAGGGADAGRDVGRDVGRDAGPEVGRDVGPDVGPEAGLAADGADADGADAGRPDVGPDAGLDGKAVRAGGAGPGRAPVTVVGHSIAGFHAEAFARLHPARTAALVLVDSSVEESPRASRTAPALSRALGAALCAAGMPAALGPAGRALTVRLSSHRRPDPSPPAEVRRVYRTSRALRGTLDENARYGAVAAELLALRERAPLPPGLPVTVLAAPDGSARWERRQRALARRLGARYEAAEPSGHLVMLDRPDAIARAVLDAGR